MKTRKVKLSMGDEWVIHLEFWCPGCRDIHSVPVSSSTGPAGFCWNGKMREPTIWPPVVIDSKNDVVPECAFTITNGFLKFTEWCLHEYAGQTLSNDSDFFPTRIENWSVLADPYQAPELGIISLQGIPENRGGRNVVTSNVLNVKGRLVFTKSGSVYELGEPDPKYVEWMKTMGREYDPIEPIKLVNPPRATKTVSESVEIKQTNPPSAPEEQRGSKVVSGELKCVTIGGRVFDAKGVAIGTLRMGERVIPVTDVKIGEVSFSSKHPPFPALDGVAVIDLSPRAPDPLEQMIEQGIFERREDGQLIMPFKTEEPF